MANERYDIIADDEAQGCRGGAAILKARMMFKAQATIEDLPLDTNLHSTVFSPCLPFDCAFLHALG